MSCSEPLIRLNCQRHCSSTAGAQPGHEVLQPGPVPRLPPLAPPLPFSSNTVSGRRTDGGRTSLLYQHRASVCWHAKKTRMVWLTWLKKFDDMYNYFDRIPACDRRTDRQTSCDGIVTAAALKQFAVFWGRMWNFRAICGRKIRLVCQK